MPINWLFENPAFFLIWVLAVIIALTIHEFSHGLLAYYFGDDTAKQSGRLTLNPLSHIDPLGFVLLLVVGFGWAKPVPVNPYNLRRTRLATAIVALAGPLSNLLALVVFGLIFRALAPILGESNLLTNFLFMLVLINLVLMLFNLLPIPPLDGSKVLFSLLPDRLDEFKYRFSINGPYILLLILMIDNFLNIGIFSRVFDFFLLILAKFI